LRFCIFNPPPYLNIGVQLAAASRITRLVAEDTESTAVAISRDRD
jgi:hypothetical protein